MLDDLCKEYEVAPTDMALQDLDAQGWSRLASVFSRYYRTHGAEIAQVLRDSAARLKDRIPAQSLVAERNIDMLRELLDLNEAEVSLLRFANVLAQFERAVTFIQHLPYYGKDHACHEIALMLGLPEPDIAAALRKNSPLYAYGLISDLSAHPGPDLREHVRLAGHLHNVLNTAHGSLDEMMRLLLQQAPWPQLEPADYAHMEQDVKLLAAALQGALRERRPGVNILIYGPPGTGKTELAKLMAKIANANLYQVTNSDDDGTAANARERYLSYVLSQRFLASRQDSLVLFDEAEDVLPAEHAAFGFGPISVSPPGQTKGKAWVNNLLETNPAPTIWICNRIDAIDPAYLRWFTYHLELRNPPRTVRHRIASKHLNGLNVSENVLSQIANYEHLAPAQLEGAARMVSLAQPAEAKATEELLLRTLQNSMNALRQPTGRGHITSATRYDLRYLNLDARFPIDKMIGALKVRAHGSLCLYGPPGTGKTQLVHHLAERLEKPLLSKRASDLFSKWLGESEQNIAAMFQQARDEDAMLFLDEADSLLGDRQAATAPWAVSLVNELLQHMEQFDGVFVCATNLFSKLDLAALRRFTLKVRFDYLSAEQRWSLFLQETGLKDDDRTAAFRHRLDRLDTLTPGDFATVRRQELALAEALSPEEFIAQLIRECEAKSRAEGGRPIGFVW